MNVPGRGLVSGTCLGRSVFLHSQFSCLSSDFFTGCNVYFLVWFRYSSNHQRVAVAGDSETKQKLLQNLLNPFAPLLTPSPELRGSFFVKCSGCCFFGVFLAGILTPWQVRGEGVIHRNPASKSGLSFDSSNGILHPTSMSTFNPTGETKCTRRYCLAQSH